MDTDKDWMAIVWVCAAAAVFVCVMLDRRARTGRVSPRAGRFLSAAAIAGFALTLVLSTWENNDAPIWTGFGPGPVLIGCAVAVPVFIAVWSRISSAVLMKLSIVVVSIVSVVPLLETPTTFASGTSYDLGFTLDEILAPATGRMAGFDYISQYETLLGFPLALISRIVPGWFHQSPESFAVAWLVLLQIGTLFLAVFAVIKVTPRRVRWLIPIIIVPVAYLVGSAGLAYFADLPIRFILPTVLLAVLAVCGMRAIRKGSSWWYIALPGLVGGAAAINNLDYGIPAFLAGLVAVSVGAPRWSSFFRAVIIYLLASLIVPIIYLAVGYLSGRTFKRSYELFFVRNFGIANELNVDMPAFGLHSAFVLVGVIGLVIGVLGLRRLRRRNAVLSKLLVFESAWMLLSLVYYSGRSLTPTLVTGSAFLLGTLLALLFVNGEPHLRRLRRVGPRTWAMPQWILAGLVVLSLGVPLAAIGWFPALQDTVNRLSTISAPKAGAESYMTPNPTYALAHVPRHDDLIGMLSVSGSIWSEKLGITNANVLVHPNYLSFNSGADLECNYLKQLPGNTLLTTTNEVTVLKTSKICRAELQFSADQKLNRILKNSPIRWVLVKRG